MKLCSNMGPYVTKCWLIVNKQSSIFCSFFSFEDSP